MSIWYFENSNGTPIVGTPDTIFTERNGVAWAVGEWFLAAGVYGRDDDVCREPASKYQSLKAWIEENFGDKNPFESSYVPGTFYKRIARPSLRDGVSVSHYYLSAATESFVALSILISKLEELFEFVTPSVDTDGVYGHKIRELLLLACMEVESSWTAVLKANGYSVPRFSTNDYIKLLPAMALDAYTVNLPKYHHYAPLIPFEGWNIAQPTQSLPWYDAYNKTKHDREANLKLATLSHAISAVSAAVVMTYAQFGFSFRRDGIDHQDLRVRSLMSPGINAFHEVFERGLYVPEMRIRTMMLQPIPTGNWTAINYPF